MVIHCFCLMLLLRCSSSKTCSWCIVTIIDLGDVAVLVVKVSAEVVIFCLTYIVKDEWFASPSKWNLGFTPSMVTCKIDSVIPLNQQFHPLARLILFLLFLGQQNIGFWPLCERKPLSPTRRCFFPYEYVNKRYSYDPTAKVIWPEDQSAILSYNCGILPDIIFCR